MPLLTPQQAHQQALDLAQNAAKVTQAAALQAAIDAAEAEAAHQAQLHGIAPAARPLPQGKG